MPKVWHTVSPRPTGSWLESRTAVGRITVVIDLDPGEPGQRDGLDDGRPDITGPVWERSRNGDAARVETGTQLVYLDKEGDGVIEYGHGKAARATPGGYVYHVLNRSVAGLPLFRKEADFGAFERIMIEAHGLHPRRILAWVPCERTGTSWSGRGRKGK